MAQSSHRSLAEQYRAHREAFLLAQDLGCTPREAAAELKRRASRAEWQESQARLAAKQAGGSASISAEMRVGHDDAADPVQQWWQKD